MTANLTLDNTLYETVLRVASARGQTLDEFAAEALETAIQGTATKQIAIRHGLPCIQPPAGTPQIDPTQVRRLVEEGVF